MKRLKTINLFIPTLLLCFTAEISIAQSSPDKGNILDLPSLNLSLDELLSLEVVSTGFFDVSHRISPGYTYVVDSTTLENTSANSLYEVMDMYAPGVSMSYHFFGGQSGQRGIDNNPKTLYMIDGKSISLRWHMGYQLPLDVPFMGDMERIEIVQGPGAIPHGSGAINGAVNMITKRGKDHQGLSIATTYGFTDQLYKLELGYGKIFEQGDLYLYFGGLRADGFQTSTDTDIVNNRQGTINRAEGDAFRAKRYKDDNFKITLNLNYGVLNFLAQYVTYHGLPFSVSNAYWADKTLSTSERSQSATWAHTYLLLKPSFDFQLNETDSVKVTTSFLAADVGRYDYNENTFMPLFDNNAFSESEYFLKTVFRTTRFDKHSLAIGFSLSQRNFYYLDPIFHDLFEPGEKNLTGLDGYVAEGRIFDWVEYALFAEDIVQVTDKLTLSLGVRLDGVKYGDTTIGDGSNSVTELAMKDVSEVVPRVSMAYQLTDTKTVKLTYQEGFRHPDASNLYSAATGELEPELMKSFEINYSDIVDCFGSRAKVDVNVYHNELVNTLGYESSAQGFANSNEPFKVIGFELIGNLNINDQLSWNASYSYSRPYDYPKSLQLGNFSGVVEVNEDRDEFVRYPKHFLKTDISWWLMERKLLAHLSIGWSSGMPDALGEETQPSWKGDRFQVDMMFRYNVSEKSWFSFVMKNLTGDHNYRPAWTGSSNIGTLGIDERMYYLSYHHKF